MGGLVGAGRTGMGKASSASGPMGLLGWARARPWIVNKVPGPQSVTYNLIPHVLPILQEEWEFLIVNSTGLQSPTVQEVGLETL